MSVRASIFARGFTLIEVLIGIVVLALGLLGLGAVIPVVVREQRNAADAALGVSVANTAEAFIRERTQPQLRTWRTGDPAILQQSLVQELGPLDMWLFNGNWGGPLWTRDGDRSQLNLWYLPPWRVLTTTTRLLDSTRTPLHRVVVSEGEFLFPQSSGDLANPGVGEAVGDMRWRAVGAERQSRVQRQNGTLGPWVASGIFGTSFSRISVGERLWPNPSVQTSETLAPGRDPYKPLFVWDFVGRRVTTPISAAAASIETPGVNIEEKLQIAVFVRRVDINIRVPRGTNPQTGADYTLFDILTGNVDDDDKRRVPVAADRDGIPTLAGIDSRDSSNPLKYSTIRSFTATFDPLNRNERNVILVSASAAERPLLRYVAVVGQKLVDNLGNVYTVKGVPDPEQATLPAGQVELFVEPPVPLGVQKVGTAVGNSDLNPSVLRQVIFTPQLPAAVRVFTISRPPGYPSGL